MAIERFVEVTSDPRIRVEHQVLADQAAGIGEAVGRP